MLDSEEELSLIKRCFRNDRRAQKKIYEHYFSRMYSVCRRYVKNQEDTLEVLNNGFLSVFKNIGQFKFEGSFEGWIKRIIINKSLDFLRNNRKYREFIQLNSQLIILEEAAEDGSDHMELSEIEEYITKLPEMLQTILHLYITEGYRHREIAEMLGINENTSRWYYLSARNMLQTSLKKNMTPEPEIKQVKAKRI